MLPAATGEQCDVVWRDARLACMTSAALQVIGDGLIACRGGRVLFAGAAADAPEFKAERTIHCDGRLITPGLIDPHTHLVYAGSRAKEHEARQAGVNYAQIAAGGGGILSTVRATRQASDEHLLSTALRRLDAMLAEGVTTVEVKSGYGLTVEHELRLLRVARRLGEARNVNVRTTLLAAHAVPPEYKGDPDSYVAAICESIIPMAAGEELADAVDVFCESVAFSVEQTKRVFEAAKKHNLPIKLHAEQLSNSHGAELAAKCGALSADHLEYLDVDGVEAMAKHSTVATLLPGAYYFLREVQKPPVDALRRMSVPIALGTDCNPGTSPITSPLITMNLASVLFGLSVEECIAGMTCNAARALGMSSTHGSLEAGKVCDLAIWNVAEPAELIYNLGMNLLHARVKDGHD